MTHTILVQNRAQAQNVDALNRSVIGASNIDNGNIFYIDGKYADVSGYSEVWEVKQPTSGSLTGLWMAYSPELVITDDSYRALNSDPRNFYNSASRVFDAFYPMKGDIITFTVDNLDSATAAAFAVAQADSFEFAWAAAPSGSLTSLKYVETTYVPVGSGSQIGTQRVTAYKFEVLNN